MNQYYTCPDGSTVVGPFTWNQLLKQLRSNKITRHTLVTPVGLESWQALETLAEYELYLLKTPSFQSVLPQATQSEIATPSTEKPKADNGCQTGCLVLILVIVIFWAVCALIETAAPTNHYENPADKVSQQIRVLNETQKRREGERQADIERYKQEALKR
jgi:hypothetical protein